QVVHPVRISVPLPPFRCFPERYAAGCAVGRFPTVMVATPGAARPTPVASGTSRAAPLSSRVCPTYTASPCSLSPFTRQHLECLTLNFWVSPKNRLVGQGL